MADSQRLTVLKRLTAHLKGITPANGYDAATWGIDYDLSTSVFRGRTIFGDTDPVPLVSILESPRSDTGLFAGEGNRSRKEDRSLLIQGWAADDVDNPTDPAYGLMDVVEHRLLRLTAVSDTSGYEIFPDEYLLGRSVADIAILPGVVRANGTGVKQGVLLPTSADNPCQGEWIAYSLPINSTVCFNHDER